MQLNEIKLKSFTLSDDKKSLSGTCYVDAHYNDGVSISTDIGNNFQMNAFVSQTGEISSRVDKMVDGSELDVIWAAVSKLSKETLAESLK